MIQHIALIMDGNRRWAKKRSLMPWLGHKQGVETVRSLVEFCIEHSISIASLYTFSLENFKRSAQEVSFLFNLIIEQSEAVLPELIEQGVCVKFIGDKNYFPAHVKPSIEKTEKATAGLSKLNLNILFCYGGRQEIINAVKNIAQDVKSGSLQPDAISETLFENYLWTNSYPDPDLIIRTGGVKRLSNFLLYRAAYSEIYFTDCLWPDLTKNDLEQALQDFKERKRNFGA